MAEKRLNTRIALKYDSYENWSKSELKLLPGEVAICEIPSGVKEYRDAEGNVIDRVQTAPTVLFKVGSGENKTFKELPWASAKAADVYDWAKAAHADVVEVENADKSKNMVLRFFNESNEKISDIDLSALATAEAVNDLNMQIKDIQDALGITDDAGTDSSVLAQLIDVKNQLKAITGYEDEDGNHVNGTIDTLAADIADKIALEDDITVAKAIDDAKTDAIDDAVAAVADILGKDLKDADYSASNTVGADIKAISLRVEALEDVAEDLDKTIDDAIAEEIKTLNSEDNTSTAGENAIVKSVSQTNGKVSVTYGKLTRAELPELLEEDIPEIHTNKVIVSDGDGTEANPKVTLDTKLGNIADELKDIRDAIAGGVHFIGSTTTDILTATEDNTAIANVIINGDSVTPNAGDVVIQSNTSQEFIWTGSKWEPLGDISRIGTLETAVATINDTIDKLDYTDTANENTFVTAVNQENGKIKVTRARPTAANVVYTEANGDDVAEVTVEGALNSHNIRLGTVEDFIADRVDIEADETVKGVIDDKITAALDALDYTEQADGAFVTGITQTDGKIAVTYGDLPSATADDAGITTLGAAGGAATYEAVNELAIKVKDFEDTKIPDLEDRAEAIENNYVKVDGDNLVRTTAEGGTEVIWFICGGAEVAE